MAFARFVLWVSGIVGVLVLAARLTVLRWWQVPTYEDEMGASITPTLWPGDWVLLWRGTDSTFGDLVVCDDPDNPGSKVIGRIVGDSRDQLRIKGADIYVNGSKVRQESACDFSPFSVTDPESGETTTQQCSIEALGSTKHFRGEVVGFDREFQTTEHEVAIQHFYLLSDNRLFPWDSRDYGEVPVDSCKERVFFRLVSKKGYFDVENRLTFIQ